MLHSGKLLTFYSIMSYRNISDRHSRRKIMKHHTRIIDSHTALSGKSRIHVDLVIPIN